jgi:hypothetical protein
MNEQLKEIVDTLVSATENGILVWKESNPNSKTRAYRRKMEAIGSDGTIFTMNIEYMLIDGTWKFIENGIWIVNDILPGKCDLSPYKYKELLKLRDLIKEKFCSDLNPKIKYVEDILSDICKNISISTLRDNKLKDLGI